MILSADISVKVDGKFNYIIGECMKLKGIPIISFSKIHLICCYHNYINNLVKERVVLPLLLF